MATDLEATIRALEERLWRAQLSGDIRELDELLADDLLFAGMDGALETKAADLEQHRSGALKILELEPLDLKILPIPSGAIASVKMAGSASIRGQRVSATLRYTRVWIQRDARWQIVGGHMSAVES